uniref:Uncharacterized protein n=1 Tax=Anguilla anguilla TaxID=7936 RepID=A0A0E9WYQ2_ANGAN
MNRTCRNITIIQRPPPRVISDYALYIHIGKLIKLCLEICKWQNNQQKYQLANGSFTNGQSFISSH